jgi:hypothetical protein
MHEKVRPTCALDKTPPGPGRGARNSRPRWLEKKHTHEFMDQTSCMDSKLHLFVLVNARRHDQVVRGYTVLGPLKVFGLELLVSLCPSHLHSQAQDVRSN